MNEKITISLEILLLNDLLSSKVIDKNIYDQAMEKIETINKENKVA
jgi:hypothetical protein